MAPEAALDRVAARGWWIVAGLSLWSAVAMGTTIGSLGVFVEPMRQEFGWSGEQIARALTAFVLAMSLVMPIVGLAIDRLGARIVMACGVVLISVSYLLAGRSQSLWMLVGSFAAAGAGLGASTYLPCTVVASEWFLDRRGLAVGVLLGSSAIGATIFPVLIAPLVLDHGWREALAGIASVTLLLGLPIAVALVRHGPYRNGEEGTASRVDRPLASLMRGRTFWLVTFILILSQLSFFGIYFHLIPFLTSLGFPETTAVLFYSGSTLATVLGAVILGPLIDRVGARPTLIAALAVLVSSCALLPAIGTGAAGVGAGIAFAVLWGSVVSSPMQFAPVLLAETAGLASLGTLLGISNLLAGLISSLGPMLTGAIHDATHSYIAAFMVSAIVAALALAPALLLKPGVPGARPGPAG